MVTDELIALIEAALDGREYSYINQRPAGCPEGWAAWSAAAVQGEW